MDGGTDLAVGVYLHIPFCRAKCRYCDFFSLPAPQTWYAPYVEALCRQMQWAASRRALRARTVYVGGGTPTVLPLDLLERLLVTCFRCFGQPATGEVTVEANPGTVTGQEMRALARMGVTRFSLGVQSLDDRELAMLGRVHTAQEARRAVEEAGDAGFPAVSLDLIFGLPGQTERSWARTVEQALALDPAHWSAYALSLEPGTLLAEDVAAGRRPAPDDDQAADMYRLLEDRLAGAGFVHYEISNWASRQAGVDFRCQHNLIYWRNEPWLGLGAGACSCLAGRRWREVEDVVAYTGAWAAGPTHGDAPLWRSPSSRDVEALTPEVQRAETMFLGLRLVEEGVSVRRFRARFGLSPAQAFPEVLGELEGLGLVRCSEERVVLTRRGRLLGNQVFMRFLP